MTVVFLLAACSASVETPTPVYLQATGATAMTPLVEDLAAAYHDLHPLTTVDVKAGGSDVGLEMVSAGQVDLGLCNWLPDGPPEGMTSQVVARDAITLIVHPTNPITGMTMIQLRDVFRGRTNDWQDVGSTPSPIQLVSREDGSGTRATFENLVMQTQPVNPTAVMMPNSQAVVDYVANTPNAIGYVSMGYVDDRVSALAIEGLFPTPENATSGAYFLIQQLAILYPQDVSIQAKAFVDFAISPTGQTIVGRKYGRVR